MRNYQYSKLVEKLTPKSPLKKDLINAFLFGGGISCFGQVLRTLYSSSSLTLTEAKTLVSVTLIIITAILTIIGVFDKLAKVAGSGSFVPITGFANSVVSPALEFKAEGHILGTGAKMFNLAGPVIVYGCGAASIYGFIYWIIEQF
ncbi:MAG: SpoVA/SpoVAEb family sporulation membrane protein [Clostridia bacterium]|nr:SpoVA/SpoVAEb family sporulation membrane protein [Clostridia bacterium]